VIFAEEYLPVYDVSDEVATVVAAEPQAVWQALREADLIEVGRRTPLAGLLGALRVLPELVSHLLHGERPPHAPAAGLAGHGPGGPAAADDVAAPAQDRVRGNQQP
jgi:hypothetical protein